MAVEHAENEEPKSDVTAGMEAEEPYPPEGYAWYVVVILMIVYIFSFIDRQILALMVGPIRADLNISDTQMSLLMGFSFAVFYTFFGIPLGRLADSRSRRGIIAAGLVVWSAMSAGCGIAKNFTHLLLFRMGVGVGEASLSPSAYSLITDYFRPNRLALAISVYGAGIYIGSGMAFLLGGQVVGFATGQADYQFPILGTVRPWQLVFFAIGIPGALFAVMLSTVKEPARRGIAKAHAATSIPLAEAWNYIKNNRTTFLCHTIGFSLLAFIGYGSSSWVPEFYIRTYGWDARFTGTMYGSAVMIFGTAGILFGGYLGGRLAAKGHVDAKMRAGLIAAVAHIPFGFLFPLMPNGYMAYAIMLPAAFTLAMPFGVAPAAIQEMMPNRMRGQAAAIYLFVVNLIGLGLGPTAVAVCTDYVFGDDDMVWASLLIVSTVAGLVATALLWAGLNPFKRSIEYRDAWQAGTLK